MIAYVDTRRSDVTVRKVVFERHGHVFILTYRRRDAGQIRAAIATLFDWHRHGLPVTTREIERLIPFLT